MDEIRFFRMNQPVGSPRSDRAEYAFLAYVDEDDRVARTLAFYAKRMIPVSKWCEDQFGPPEEGRWVRSVGCFYFWDEARAAMFKMRWC
ncbi:MAG: hypothetical protein EOP83_08620 [Verrucomicrobiaceae bacterium]|nr:MAG: hypothetical protein EOP83_08620 [Verrucomicrobiaceae bacterium]